MSKHKYSTIALIFFIGLLFVGAVAGLFASGDMDILCSTNGASILRVGGTWVCDTTHYGEVYYHHESDALVLDIVTPNNYTQLTGFNISNVQNITVTNESMTLKKNATYQIDSSMSFTGGANGVYHCAIFVGAVEQEDCEFQRTMGGSSIGVATITCLKTGIVDQELTYRCADTNNPVADMQIYAFNWNVVQIK